MSIKFSEGQIEKIHKEIDKSVSICVLLENDLGTQRDIPSANAVCVIKDILQGVKGLIAAIEEKNNNMCNDS